jgi:hypothetical protein
VIPIANAVPGAVAALLRSSPLSPGKVEFAWKAAVGPAIQRVTAVKFESGVLFVDATSAPWAREVSRSSGMILSRMQALLGAGVIKEIVVRA